METHIASPVVTINDRYLRQRCGWCGVVMGNVDRLPDDACARNPLTFASFGG